MEPNTQVVIKRYPNRKLYDTRASSYTTLTGLTVMLRNGIDVLIIDAKSKEDITGQILASALLDRKELFKDTSSVAALKQILRSTNPMASHIKEGA
jgi:polyhydroxyalkanoate synthesis repressor PhaR